MQYQMFEYNPVLRLVVCRDCEVAVRKWTIVSHVKNPRHGLRHSEAKEIAKVISRWEDIDEEAEQGNIPQVFEEEVPGLPVYPDGLTCKVTDDCMRTFRSLNSLKEHFSHQHNFTTGRAGGRTARENEELQQHVKRFPRVCRCQRVFGTQQGSHYVLIKGSEDEMEMAGQPTRNDGRTLIEKTLRKWEEDFGMRAEQVFDGADNAELSMWLRRTGWTEYLSGYDVGKSSILMSLSTTSDILDHDTELAIGTLGEALDGMARKCRRAVKTTGTFVRQEVTRLQKGQAKGKPLVVYADDKEACVDVAIWKKMLYFLARTMQGARQFGSPVIGFTASQNEKWRILWRRVLESLDAGQGSIDEGSQNEQGDDGEFSRMVDACLDFCVELLNQRFAENEYDCALVCLLALMGWHADGRGSWVGPESYCITLSKIIRMSRHMVVTKAKALSGLENSVVESEHRVGDSAMILEGTEGTGHNLFVASLPTVSHIQPTRTLHGTLRTIMDGFMIRGSFGPMQWVLDLRAYGQAICTNTPSGTLIGWAGPDEVLFSDKSLRIATLRDFIHNMVGSARGRLHSLLLGMESPHSRISLQRQEMGRWDYLPAVPWETLRDNEGEKAFGFSFLDDKRARWPVNGASWLMDKIQKNETLRRCFINSTVGHDGEWRLKYVQQYLTSVTAFQELLSILVHITGGQPTSGVELMSIRHRNAPDAKRNIFIDDGMVTFVSHYVKGFNVENDGKLLRRYVPREVGELVVQYLWLVLPFVLQLHSGRRGQPVGDDVDRQMSGGGEDDAWQKLKRHEQFSKMWGVDASGREWASTRFGKLLRHQTQSLTSPSSGLTIPEYRMMAIGISRRYLPLGNQFWEETEIDVGENLEDGFGAIGNEGLWVDTWRTKERLERQVGGVLEERFRMKSMCKEWHNFLGFASEKAERDERKRRRRALSGEEGDTDLHLRRLGERVKEMESVFEGMMGKGRVRFSNDKDEAIRAVGQGENIMYFGGQ